MSPLTTDTVFACSADFQLSTFLSTLLAGFLFCYFSKSSSLIYQYLIFNLACHAFRRSIYHEKRSGMVLIWDLDELDSASLEYSILLSALIAACYQQCTDWYQGSNVIRRYYCITAVLSIYHNKNGNFQINYLVGLIFDWQLRIEMSA